MNKLAPLALALLMQGCVTADRKWDLGTCIESAAGAYGCTVRLPRSAAAVQLSAKIDSPDRPGTEPDGDLTLRLRNEEDRTIVVQGLQGRNVYLRPSGDVEVTARRGAGGWAVCGFDTSNGAIQIRVEVLRGRPAGATIRIWALSSDAL
jgi:hypothetical protein